MSARRCRRVLFSGWGIVLGRHSVGMACCFILVLGLVLALAGCRPSDPGRKGEPTYGSRIVEQLNASLKRQEVKESTINLSSPSIPPTLFKTSQFHSSPEKQIVALSVKSRGREFPSSLVRQRVYQMMQGRMSDPFEVVYASELRRGVERAATVKVMVRHRHHRKRRDRRSKRNLLQLEVDVSFEVQLDGGGDDLLSSWDDWQFHYAESLLGENYEAQKARFWENFDASLPDFYLTRESELGVCLRRERVDEMAVTPHPRALMHISEHRVFDEDCVTQQLSGAPVKKATRHFVWSYADRVPKKRAHVMSKEPTSLYCQSDGMAALTFSTNQSIELAYYARSDAAARWQDSLFLPYEVERSLVSYMRKDATLCVLLVGIDGKGSHIACYDVADGEQRWRWGDRNLHYRSHSRDDRGIWLATDDAIVLLSWESGQVIERIATGPRPISANIAVSCETRSHWIYSPSPRNIVVFNKETKRKEAEIQTMGTRLVVCDPRMGSRLIYNDLGTNLFAIDLNGMQPLWRLRLGELPLDVAVTDGGVFLLGRGHVSQVSLSSGRLQCRFPLRVTARQLLQHGDQFFIDTSQAIYYFFRSMAYDF